uniref:Uncharacterized protein n=1 Tax=Siphoviridae sp. ctoOf8 TaxID=2825668 RepID=A0A8S5QFT2_9CAUD|nr:MAG TPA: hypothetical protein [Siphoviridae sp. ctoOf8]DAZ18983.1 MAG TPA: hypothetical protein [Caudoviricetes sp.]
MCQIISSKIRKPFRLPPSFFFADFVYIPVHSGSAIVHLYPSTQGREQFKRHAQDKNV